LCTLLKPLALITVFSLFSYTLDNMPMSIHIYTHTIEAIVRVSIDQTVVRV